MGLLNLLKRDPGQYSIMIVPANSARMKSYKFKHNSIRRIIIAALAGFVAMLLLIAALAVLPYIKKQDPEIVRENIKLSNELAEVRSKLVFLDHTLDRVEKFDRKLRVMTDFVDNRRKAAIGPLSENEMTASQFGNNMQGDGALALLLREKLGELQSADLSKEIDRLLETALEREKELAELGNFLEDQKLLLSHVPSIRPTEGWLTSGFGQRTSPFTNTKIFHEGIDIANNIGTPIYAPADGTVIFSGNRNGYGQTLVINHGFGITTRYGHLSEFKTRAGKRIKRGDLIATIGNTGRSTGPHLHYEVRVNNIPQNPQRYILE